MFPFRPDRPNSLLLLLLEAEEEEGGSLAEDRGMMACLRI